MGDTKEWSVNAGGSSFWTRASFMESLEASTLPVVALEALVAGLAGTAADTCATGGPLLASGGDCAQPASVARANSEIAEEKSGRIGCVNFVTSQCRADNMLRYGCRIL